jgi:formylglycine-generating enzyme required for sulfatase activity
MLGKSYMSQIPQDFVERVVEVLLPHMRNVTERRVLLEEAFYRYEPRLFDQIELNGDRQIFTKNCVEQLIEFGCLPQDIHSVSRLLGVVLRRARTEDQQKINELIGIANAICPDNSLLPSEAPTKKTVIFAVSPLPEPEIPTQDYRLPIDQRSPTVFVSYHRSDERIARKIIVDLNRGGHACWIDAAPIKGGDAWIPSITEGINNSYAFVMLISDESKQNHWVYREFLWAEDRQKKIIPLKIDNCDYPSRLHRPNMITAIDMFDEDVYIKGIATLLNNLPSPIINRNNITKQSTRSITVRGYQLEYLDRLRFEQALHFSHTRHHTQNELEEPGIDDFQINSVTMNLDYLSPIAPRQESALQDNPFDKLLQMKRVIYLSPPGGGKTTSLWTLASRLIEQALGDIHMPIPVMASLERWFEADQDFQTFLANQMGDLGQFLPKLLHDKIITLFIDGLNDIPSQQLEDKTQSIINFLKENPDISVHATCRVQTYDKLSANLRQFLERVDIATLNPIQIYNFLQRVLQDDRLFSKIIGEVAQNTYRRFIAKFAQVFENPDAVFWLEQDLPNAVHWGHHNEHWIDWLNQRDEPTGLLEMAKNPLMLSMLTKVYKQRGDLPNNQTRLIGDFIKVLLSDASETDKQMLEEIALDDELSHLAYHMQIKHYYSRDEQKLVAIPQLDTHEIFSQTSLELASRVRLVSIGEHVRFTHHMLQDYFVAQRLNTLIREEPETTKAEDFWFPYSWWKPSHWDDIVVLLTGFYSEDSTPILEWLGEVNPELTAKCIVHSGSYTPLKTIVELRKKWWKGLLTESESPEGRASIGRALGQVEVKDIPIDNRRGVGITEDKLPDIDWVLIPAGEFYYQNNQRAHLPDYYISRYPVTYAQFQTFVRAEDGYHHEQWWQHFPEEIELAGVLLRTRENHGQHFQYSNSPCEMVTVWQAIAFCRWLSYRFGFNIGLPDEKEWEKAARGTDKRIYPWGDTYREGYANIDETHHLRVDDAVGSHYLRQTSAVGMYLQGKSPYGLMDMSGNVWEWCIKDQTLPHQINLNQFEFMPQGTRKGGSWGLSSRVAQINTSDPRPPFYRSADTGFRLRMYLW